MSCRILGRRVLCDVKPTLAPSYRILFENVDKTVDTGGYPNRHPVHLKCLAISGLPVDEIPCVEVWDMHGLVFNSHAGWKSTNKCTWSSEYGDGFFRVSHDILGDFSVMCRFGGHHALTRDKTTLIFKYQNNTGASLFRRPPHSSCAALDCRLCFTTTSTFGTTPTHTHPHIHIQRFCLARLWSSSGRTWTSTPSTAIR